MKLLEWGNVALARIDLKTLAHPHLVKLAHETRKSFYLALLDHDEIILVDRANRSEIWKMATRLGYRSPFHCTATGLMITADEEPDEVEGMIERHGLKRFASKTITSPSKLKKRLAEVRQTAYAIVDGECKLDVFTIAVPIWDHRGRVVGVRDDGNPIGARAQGYEAR